MFFGKERELLKRMYKACDPLQCRRFVTIKDKIKNFPKEVIERACDKGRLADINPERIISAHCLVSIDLNELIG